MRFVRILAIVAIAGLLSAGVVVDLQDRPAAERAASYESALAVVGGRVNTWFCPGGGGAGGPVELTIELVSASQQPRSAAVSVLAGGPGAPGDRTVDVQIEPRGRVALKPARHVPGAEWVGAVVEVDGPDVVVEQVVAAEQGVGRSPCLTRTSDRWIVSNGATRLAVEGERFLLMLLNPFPDFAVADIDLLADVGRDSVKGLVVPARRVVALDVTEEVTVAETVAAFVDVVAGRLAVSWIQLSDGASAGRGARLAPGVPGAATLWYLPVAAVAPGRTDVVAISNPSPDEVAEVDLEIAADAPGTRVNPIEVTVGPGRTALVDLSETDRLEGLGSFSVVVRSLEGVPVTASITSVTSAAQTADAAGVLAGAAAAIGADAAARHWLVPVEATDADAQAASGDDASAVAVVNPSSTGIAVVSVSVDGEAVRSLELGPGRRGRLSLGRLGSGRFMLEIESSSPVIVGRELVGLTSRSAALGVAVSEPVPLAAVG